MQVGILDRKNERTPSFLFIMTENKLRRRTGKSTKRNLHPGKTEYLFIKTKKSKIFEPWVTDYSTWVSDDFTLEFIGGEPFLYPELINNIVGYFYQSCINNLTLDIWERTTISINSNGTLYQVPAVKEFINRYSDKIVLRNLKNLLICWHFI